MFARYSPELRGLVVQNLSHLFHCSAIQGSWQSMHLLLQEFVSLRQPEPLLEGLRHVLRSKAFFGVNFKARGADWSSHTAGLAPSSANHCWCKCVDALVFYGLGSWSLPEALGMIQDTAMKKLVKKLVKMDDKLRTTNKGMMAVRVGKPVQQQHRMRAPKDVIPVAPSSPPQFEQWNFSNNPLRIQEQLYQTGPERTTQRVKASVEAREAAGRQWHRLHPLYVHLLHRLEEDKGYIVQDVAADFEVAEVELHKQLAITNA